MVKAHCVMEKLQEIVKYVFCINDYEVCGVDIFETFKSETNHVPLNKIFELYAHIHHWSKLTIEEKECILSTAGWAVIFKYITHDEDIDEIVTNKINSCGFNPCNEITEDMLYPVNRIEYVINNGEIHHFNCTYPSEGCYCFTSQDDDSLCI